MGHQITVKIGVQEYVLKSETPEKEEAIRRAAAEINRMIATYQEKFPKKSMVDILSFVALNEGISCIGMQKKIYCIENECRQLGSELEGYLENIDK